jgi:hypothetical protein
LPEFVEVPDAARDPKPLFPQLPDFSIVREVREWLAQGNPTYTWRGHTHTKPDKDEPVEFIGLFSMPKRIEAPCPCCTPNHTKFGKGVVGWFPQSNCIRLMGEHCFKRLNPEGYAQAYDRMEQRQGRRSTISYLVANLHKKEMAREAVLAVMPLAEHLDELQDILGGRVRQKLGIDLWQCLREGGNLKISVESRQGAFSSTYANVAGYRLVDPARKKLVPTLRTIDRTFGAIGYTGDIASWSDTERKTASRLFSRGLTLAREILYDLGDLRRFVSIQSTATIRNWSQQQTAAASIYIRREGLALLIGKSESDARKIVLRDCIDMPISALPDLDTTG